MYHCTLFNATGIHLHPYPAAFLRTLGILSCNMLFQHLVHGAYSYVSQSVLHLTVYCSLCMCSPVSWCCYLQWNKPGAFCM